MMKLILFAGVIVLGFMFHLGWYFLAGVIVGAYIGNMKK